MIKNLEIFYQRRNPSQVCLFCVPNQEMTVFETANFRLLADTFPIIPGHLMISSKEHYSSAGELPDHLHEEFFQLKLMSTKIALKMGNSYVFYEHGKAGSCHALSLNDIHCEHFHLHCLPASLCIHSIIAKEFSGIRMENYDTLFSYYSKYGSYLYFENSSREMVYYPAEHHEVPSHYLRTLICEELKVSTLADWKTYNDLNRHIVSHKKIAEAFTEKADNALF